MLCSHFAALSFYLLLALSLSLSRWSRKFPSLKAICHARTHWRHILVAYISQLSTFNLLSLPLPARLSLSFHSHFVSPSAFLHIDFDTWQSFFVVVVVVAAVNMSSWLVCPTSLTASSNPDPGQWAGWTCLTSSTQHAARKAQRAIVSVKRVATATKTAMKCTYTHSTKYICTHACTQNIFVCVIYIFRCCCSCHVGVAINKPTLLCGMLCDARVSQTKASYSYCFWI